MPAILNRRDYGETISHERKRSRVTCSAGAVPEARLIELARRYERGEELFLPSERSDHPDALSPALSRNESDPPDYDSEPGGASDFSSFDEADDGE